MPLSFKEKVIRVVHSIPKGKVLSYGQVAAYIGHPRAARQVGGTLRSLEADTKLPWWRVVNNAGEITIKGNYHNTKEIQKHLLEKEGVEVNRDFTFNIERYRFIPSPAFIKKLLKE